MTATHSVAGRMPAGIASKPGKWPTLLALLVASALATAEPTRLTEQQAIEFALQRASLRAIESSELSIADSEVLAAGTPANPSLSIGQENTGNGASQTREFTLEIQQTVDLAGKRPLYKAAAEQRAEAKRLAQFTQRAELAAEVRKAHAAALYRKRMEQLQGAWLQRLESAHGVVTKLAKGGEVAGFDRRRLERELQNAQARKALAAGEAERAQAALASLIGQPMAQAGEASGELLPADLPPLAGLLASQQQRDDFSALEASALAFDREKAAASKLRIPDLTIGIGGKRTDSAGQNENGVLLNVSIPIPLFDQGQAAVQRASAGAAATRAEREMKLQRQQAELQALWQQARNQLLTAESYRQQSAPAARQLSRIAEIAYRAGESGILELLDAYRGELDAAITALDYAYQARITRIELDTLAGAKRYE